MNIRGEIKKRAWWNSLRHSFPEAQDDAVADFEKALQAAVKEMAIEYGCYYVDEEELKSRIDECVTVGLKAMVKD